MNILKLRLHIATAIAFASAAIISCTNDSDLNALPGASLVSGDNTEVIIDSSFTLTAQTVPNNALLARTTTQLLGAINAPQYGRLKADFVCQLFPSNSIDTAANVTPDSMKIQLVFEKNGFVGDSIAPIGIEAYPLTAQLPYPIYSSFSPSKSQIYNPRTPLGQTTFSAVGISVNDTVAANPYRFAYITLPKTFADGIINKYKQQPQLFNDPYQFQTFFPGLYIKHTYGSGRVTRITDCRIVYYYHKTYPITDSNGNPTDSISKLYSYIMAMAPELVSNTCIDIQPSQSLKQMALHGRSIIAAPAAYDATIQFPLNQILSTLSRQNQNALTVVNTLTLTLPADSIPNSSGITPPGYLLMVLTKDKDKFFQTNSLPDKITSFIGTYNPETNAYTFGDLKELIDYAQQQPQPLSPDQYTFTLTPVTLITESTSNSYGYDYSYLYNPYYTNSSSTTLLSGIAPLTAMPAMVELQPQKAKIRLTLAKQTY